MKKNFAVVILTSMFSFATNAESPCRVAVVLNGVVQSWMTTTFTVAINPGDTLQCTVATGSPCGTCTIDSMATYWIFQGDTMHVVSLAATDTGVYTLYAQSNGSSFCAHDYNTFLLTINYVTTPVTSMAGTDGIRVSTTGSGGIFKINGAGQNFRQLLITDCVGKIVFVTQHNFSEIDLSRFPAGIYFYAINDEKNKVWRGRIVKE